MRAISLVNKLEFDFSSNVVRNALALDDVDNDGSNELIVGNESGEVTIIKGREKIQTITKLSFVTCVAVGDVLNQNKNSLVIVTADGWCYIYEAPTAHKETADSNSNLGVEEVDGQAHSTSQTNTMTETQSSSESSNFIFENKAKNTKENRKPKELLLCIHKQRIPANAKNILLGDVNGDGSIEMVLGLTDRVVRSYRWLPNPNKPSLDNITDDIVHFEPADKLLGKFIALNKWECANQIGSITLHHSFDGKPSLLIAQPGGTFMRIRCQSDDSFREQDAERQSSGSNSQAALKATSFPKVTNGLVEECADALQALARNERVTLMWVPVHTSVPGNEKADDLARAGAEMPYVGPEPGLGLNRRQVRAVAEKWPLDALREEWTTSDTVQIASQNESIPGSVDYQFLGISRMRNQNISTEIIGDLKCSKQNSFDKDLRNIQNVTKLTTSSSPNIKGKPYAVATLDGTIMLVQDEVILWAFAVDHQVFALTKLDITGDGCDDIVVCSWDGQTYILDQEKNSVRFHLEEPVQAFHSGWYGLEPDEPDVTALVYVTFKNKIIIYYDIPLRDLTCKKFEPDLEKLSELFIDESRNAEQALSYVRSMDKKNKRELVEYLLYHVKS